MSLAPLTWKKSPHGRGKALHISMACLIGLSLFVLLRPVPLYTGSTLSTTTATTTPTTVQSLGIEVGDLCKSLPNIRRSGHFLYDKGKLDFMSPDGIEPRIHLGVPFEWAAGMMAGEKANFRLIREYYQKYARNNGIAFDVGANRGFFTYYLATLGWETHAFEIESAMFDQLSHGTLYNPKQVADRVHLYPIGLSNYISRSGQKERGGLGFLDLPAADGGGGTGTATTTTNTLADLGDGPVLAIPMDCLLWHVPVDLNKVDFVKIDVEGFEIAVLQGLKQSLLRYFGSVGALLIEVGPARWERANISLDVGIQEMQALAKLFSHAYILLRDKGECPFALADHIISYDKNNNSPTIVETERMYPLQQEDWLPLLTGMAQTNSDCNFWFANNT